MGALGEPAQAQRCCKGHDQGAGSLHGFSCSSLIAYCFLSSTYSLLSYRLQHVFHLGFHL